MKYLVKYNAGYGEETEIIEAENQDEATKTSYEVWREAAENNADYSAEPLTKELAEEYNLSDELGPPTKQEK